MKFIEKVKESQILLSHRKLRNLKKKLIRTTACKKILRPTTSRLNYRKTLVSNLLKGLGTYNTALKNKFRGYKYPLNSPNTAMNRLNGTSELVDLEIKPKFQLNYETPIFITMGSCFMRNIEHHLIQNNANLVLEEFGLPKRFINPEIGWLKEAIEIHGEDEGYRQVSRSSINKYTPHSMLNEFERVLTDLHDDIPNSGIIVQDDKIVDLQVKHTIPQNLMMQSR